MRPQVQGAGARAGEQDRAHPRDGGRLLLSAEPAQPHHPVAPPARLRAQAAHLPRRAASGAAAQHAGARPGDHAAADRWRSSRAREGDYWTPKNYDGGGGGIITLRRALEHSKNLATVNLLDGGIDGRSRAQPRPDLRARPGGAGLQASACTIIRSCSAPSRCGRSISPRSTPRSPTKGCSPTPHAIESIERNGLVDLSARIRKRRRQDRLGRLRVSSTSSRR